MIQHTHDVERSGAWEWEQAQQEHGKEREQSASEQPESETTGPQIPGRSPGKLDHHQWSYNVRSYRIKVIVPPLSLSLSLSPSPVINAGLPLGYGKVGEGRGS